MDLFIYLYTLFIYSRRDLFGTFQIQSSDLKFCSSREQSQAFLGMALFSQVIHGRKVLSFSFRLFGLTFNKRQFRNEDSLQQGAEIASISISLV